MNALAQVQTQDAAPVAAFDTLLASFATLRGDAKAAQTAVKAAERALWWHVFDVAHADADVAETLALQIAERLDMKDNATRQMVFRARYMTRQEVRESIAKADRAKANPLSLARKHYEKGESAVAEAEARGPYEAEAAQFVADTLNAALVAEGKNPVWTAVGVAMAGAKDDVIGAAIRERADHFMARAKDQADLLALATRIRETGEGIDVLLPAIRDALKARREARREAKAAEARKAELARLAELSERDRVAAEAAKQEALQAQAEANAAAVRKIKAGK